MKMEISIEEKARRYDEAYKKVAVRFGSNVADEIFPELKESEDERIRKEIISALKYANYKGVYDKHLAWLEKKDEQKSLDDVAKEITKNKEAAISFLKSCGIMNANGELADEYKVEQDKQKSREESLSLWKHWKDDVARNGGGKPADNLEPKFKVGDWVVYNRNDHSREIMQIYDIKDGRYYFTDNVHFSWSIKECDEKSHPWSIEDAKDGDVLATKVGGVFIYKELLHDKPFAHCGVDKFGVFKDCNCGDGLDWTPYLSNVTPATKEQRGLLFQKMHEASYEWDAEKKEVKKIEQKQEWSEEDEEMIEGLTNCLDELEKEHGWNYVYVNNKDIKLNKVREWLKFLRPQNKWKPSDEQMDAVKDAIDYLGCNTKKVREYLMSLYEQLKKLREE